MVTNPYLNHFVESEQDVTESLIEEVIQSHGHDVYYIVRSSDTPDSIYNEDDTNYYEKTFSIEVYYNNFSGYSGDGELFTKFGLEVRDEMVVTLTRKRFNEEVASHDLNLIRPREGDIIYSPLAKDFFIIKFVDHRAVFYQLGKLYTYELRLSKFEYQSEVFKTGIEEIDKINRYSNIQEPNNPDIPGNQPKPNDGSINDELGSESEGFIDFTERNPFSMRNR